MFSDKLNGCEKCLHTYVFKSNDAYRIVTSCGFTCPSPCFQKGIIENIAQVAKGMDLDLNAPFVNIVDAIRNSILLKTLKVLTDTLKD